MALNIPSEVETGYQRLVSEASALFKSYPYREYRFLLTLSDHVQFIGHEHHESTDIRLVQRGVSDPNARQVYVTLAPHELVHPWNGKYRRPAPEMTPDFQAPLGGELIWVYEGLTEFLGTVLAARGGLMTTEQWQERLAAVASTLDHRAGRSWRSLQDTSDSAQVLYFAPPQWASARRGIDFYSESIFLWLDVDMTLRRLSRGEKSIDDFCVLFHGGAKGQPAAVSYTFQDVVGALNRVVPNDWADFLRQRLDYTGSEFQLRGLADTGYRLIYNNTPNEYLKAEDAFWSKGNFTSSVGLIVKSDGEIEDVVPDMPAALAGVTPYSRILSVNERQFSIEQLNRVVAASKSDSAPLELVVSNAGTVERHVIEYRCVFHAIVNGVSTGW